MCVREEKEPRFYVNVSYPHYYIMIWIECKRRAIEGVTPYPQSGDWFAQDAQLALAFEVLDEMQLTHQQQEETREKALKVMAEQFGQPR